MPIVEDKEMQNKDLEVPATFEELVKGVCTDLQKERDLLAKLGSDLQVVVEAS